MTLIQVVVLALIQGLTEFLPISSSAHLILGGRAVGWPEQGLVFDVATHLGTVLAAVVYFRHDIVRMTAACLRAPASGEEFRDRRLVGLLVLASGPALLAGYYGSALVESHLRDVKVIAYATVGFGLLLWWADAKGGRGLDFDRLNWRHAVAIGVAQVLSLIPGVSRSGITITAGRFLGLDAHSAARFSFLLSIPITAAAGVYGALRVWQGSARIEWFEFWLGVGLSAVAGWACIAAFLALVRRIGLLPFVAYRLALGLFLLWLTW